jgi:hypothetical protein
MIQDKCINKIKIQDILKNHLSFQMVQELGLVPGITLDKVLCLILFLLFFRNITII